MNSSEDCSGLLSNADGFVKEELFSIQSHYMRSMIVVNIISVNVVLTVLLPCLKKFYRRCKIVLNLCSTKPNHLGLEVFARNGRFPEFLVSAGYFIAFPLCFYCLSFLLSVGVAVDFEY